jgi:hypothetical protein
LISDGVTGRLVAVGDEYALASAMADLLLHPGKTHQMAIRFQEYVRKNLSWEQTYKKYLQFDSEAEWSFAHTRVSSTVGPVSPVSTPALPKNDAAEREWMR